ncbi:MAG: hypothetical protein WD894_16790 [Pirellulales bacterium]
MTNLVSDGDRDIFVANYQADGTLAWARRFGGPRADSLSQGGVKLDASGKIYVVCDFSGTVTFGGDPTFGDLGTFTFTADSTTDHVVLRFDASGKLEWATWFGGAFADGFALNDSGSIYVAGQFDGTRQFGHQQLTAISNGRDSLDGFLSRLDAETGQFVWTTKTGGKGSEWFNDIVFDAGSGSLYLTGGYTGQAVIGSTTLKANNLNSKGFVAKADQAGNFLWAKSLDGGGTGHCAAMVDGNVVVAGFFEDTATFGNIRLTNSQPGPDLFLASLQSDGKVNWAVSAAGVGSGRTEIYPRAITADASGNLFVAGNFRDQYDGTASAQFGADLLVSSGNSDLFVSQVNGASGQFLKSWRMGGTSGDEFASSLTVDAAGNLWMDGSFAGMADFPNGETQTSVNNSRDIFLLKFLQSPPTATATAPASLQTTASADKPARNSAVFLDATAVQQLCAEPERTWTFKSRVRMRV